MITTFIYKGKTLSTPNLEKKLKRLKITLDDIEIIDTPIKKEEQDSLENPALEKIIVRSTQDDIRRLCYVQKGKKPAMEELFKNQIWNPITKTGLYTKEFLKTMYYEN